VVTGEGRQLLRGPGKGEAMPGVVAVGVMAPRLYCTLLCDAAGGGVMILARLVLELMAGLLPLGLVVVSRPPLGGVGVRA